MTDKPNTTDARQPVPAYILPYADRDTEVNLIDLWRVLLRHKLIILGTLLLVLIFSAVYLLTAKPIYTATARLLPPTIENIKELLLAEPEIWSMAEENGVLLTYNTNRSLLDKYGLETITPLSVFRSFARNYDSSQVRREFSGSDDLPNFRLTEINSKSPIVVASYSHQDPEFAANQLNHFIEFVDKYTAKHISRDIEEVVEIELEKIARELDIRTNQIKQGQGESKSTGSDAMHAELNQRSEDAKTGPVIELINDKIAYFNSISIESERISSVSIDSAAISPAVPDRPNKRLVLTVSIAFGLLLGVFAAFIAEFVQKARRQA